MMRFAVILGLLGLAIATSLIIWSGYEQVLQALSIAGWGIVWTSLYHLVPMTISIIGWQLLLPGKKKASRAFFLYLLWIRASINNLMPVARIGGEIVAVRLLMIHGIKKSPAIACTVVETTLSVVAVFLFTVLGVAMFTLRISDQNIEWQLMMGLLVSLPLIIALFVVQKIGVFGLLNKIFNLMFRDKWKSVAGSTARLDHAVRTMYRRRGRILACGWWQFASWVSGTGEIWLALYFLGHQMPLAECFMIEALIQATSSAAFIVPGALGVQEAGFLMFGHLLGLTPEISAAMAIIRRCRDILIYVPGLIFWQAQEGRLLLFKKK
ncbi:MAG: flippase-like domain-containing protein [Alphaproteobacteria bacterium]|nr:flippase-like domain-containing protein [Alphaproteobacteria bacterium]